MRVVDPEQMRRMDVKTIEGYGLPGICLMENAGKGVAGFILEGYPSLIGKRVSIFCGRGNNGGDGFVAARYFKNNGVNVDVYILAKERDVKGDALTNLNVWKAMGEKVFSILKPGDIEDYRSSIVHSKVIVDAIFGTGLKTNPQGIYAAVIDYINSLNIPVVSVDIPSGLNGRTGYPMERAVKADLTVTLGFPKIGLLVYPGIDYTGELKVVDIGMPAKVAEEENTPYHLIDEVMVKGILRRRRGDAHKGEAGHLLVLAGSCGKTGAAALTSIGALRAGCGLVTLGIPRSLNPVMEEKLTEVMTYPLEETEEATISSSAIEAIWGLIKMRKAVAIGPGLTTHPEVKEVVLELIERSPVPLIIDADAINCLVGETDTLKKAKSPCILTPHPGEMGRLLSMTPDELQRERVDIARGFAMEHKVYVVLKGARTLVADPEGQLYINPTGNPGMATAGTGDVLTGIIGGFLCQGYLPLHSSILGVYLHGKAGDRVACERGEIGIIATDLLDSLPKVIKDY